MLYIFLFTNLNDLSYLCKQIYASMLYFYSYITIFQTNKEFLQDKWDQSKKNKSSEKKWNTSSTISNTNK